MRVRGSNLSAVAAVVCLVAPLATSSRAQAPSSPPAGSTATWAQVGYLKASNPGEDDQFGHAVAVSGDGTTLAVGAPMEGSGAAGINGNQADNAVFAAGAVYVFTRRGNSWSQQAYVKASNPRALDQFGFAVALSGDGNTLAVAAPYESSGATGINGNQTDDSVPQAGAVYVFTRAGSTWVQQAYVKASNTGEKGDGDTFGYTLALSEDGQTLAVGAPSEDSAAGGINGDQADNSAMGAGAVYVFTRSGDRWSQQAYIKSSTPTESTAGDLFGYAVGLSADGNALAVGVYDEGGSSNVINGPLDAKTPGTGAAYVFTRRGTTWSREAYLKASTQDRNDSMGAWLGISADGSTVAVGALDEDSLTTGINAVQTGNVESDTSAGAAYVFARSGAPWSQQASFKASNTGLEDWFGVRLALSGDGDTLAVASPNEDSAATGIDGNQRDDSAAESGAVYVFTRRGGGVWSQAAYVKASDTDEFDAFGSSVALSSDGKVMAVGARLEDSGATGFDGNQRDRSVPRSGAVYIFAR